MNKYGRNLYNNSITTKELNDQKALLYFGYYNGNLSIGNKEEHVKLFLNHIMNIDFTEYKRLNKL